MQHSSNKAASTGFSLIEILVTLVVLGVGLIALARFQVTMMQGGTLARERTEAVTLAQEKMEQLRSYRSTKTLANEFDYGDIISSTNTTKETVSGINAIYTRVWSVTTSVANAAYQYKDVTVTVTWPSKAGADANDSKVVLTSVISNTDPRYTAEIN